MTVAELSARVTALETENKKLTDAVKAADDKATAATQRADKAEADLKAANEAKATAETACKTAEGKVTKLEGEAKTAEQRALEIAAANGGAAPSKKDGTATQSGDADLALYERYAKMPQGVEKSAFLAANTEALQRGAAAFDRQAKAG